MKNALLFPALTLACLLGALPAFGQSSLDQKPAKAGKMVSDDLKLKPPPFWMNYQGKIYENVELTGVEDEGKTAVFSTSQGPLRIKWADAPTNLRDRFVKEFMAMASGSNVPRPPVEGLPGEALQPGVRTLINVIVVQKIPDGLLVAYDKKPGLLTGMPNEASLQENATFSVNAIPNGWFFYMTVGGVVAKVQRLRYIASGPPQ